MPVLDDRGTTPWIARTAHYATTTSQREAVCSACCSTRPRGSSCPGTKVGKRRVVEDEDGDDDDPDLLDELAELGGEDEEQV